MNKILLISNSYKGTSLCSYLLSHNFDKNLFLFFNCFKMSNKFFIFSNVFERNNYKLLKPQLIFLNQRSFHTFTNKGYCPDTLSEEEEEEASVFTEDYLKPADPNPPSKKALKKSLEAEQSMNLELIGEGEDTVEAIARHVLFLTDQQFGTTHSLLRVSEIVFRAFRFNEVTNDLPKDDLLFFYTLLGRNMPLYKMLISDHLKRVELLKFDYINYFKTLALTEATINDIISCFNYDLFFIKALEESLAVEIIDFLHLLLTKKNLLEKKVVSKFKKIVKEREALNFDTSFPEVDATEFLGYEVSLGKVYTLNLKDNNKAVSYTVTHVYYKDLLLHLQRMHDCLYESLTGRVEQLRLRGIARITNSNTISIKDKKIIIAHFDNIANFILLKRNTEIDYITQDLYFVNDIIYSNIALTLNEFQFNLYLAKKNKIEFCKKNILNKPKKISREQKKINKELAKIEAREKKILLKEDKRQQKLAAKAAKLTPRQQANRLRKFEEAIAAVLGPSSNFSNKN